MASVRAPSIPGSASPWQVIALDACAAWLAGLMILPLLVGISPRIYWDVSPLHETQIAPITTFGPAGAAWLSVAAILGAAATLLVHAWAGGKLHRVSILLVGLGMLGAARFLLADSDSAFRVAQWIAGISAGLAAFHLAQHERPRRLLAAALLGSIVAMALQAILFVLVDHPATVAFFKEREAQTVAEHGWAWESPQHLIYRRRLTSPDATGVLGFSNVLGSLAAALTALSLAWTVGLLNARQTRTSSLSRALLPGALALLAGTTLLLSRSRGAMVALFLAMILLGIIWLLQRTGRLRRWIWLKWGIPLALLLGVALVVLIVMVRGLVGPGTDVHSERSLLFRAQYWEASVRMLTQAPGRWLTGVGPGNYKALYAQVKNPLNPEDVASAHNVAVDYIVMLGLPGLLLTVLLGCWLWRSGRAVTAEVAGEPVAATPAERRQYWLLAYLLGGALFVTQYLVQFPTMTSERALMWIVSVAAFVSITVVLRGRDWCGTRWLTMGLTAAALVLLMHGQIEMTFFHQGAVIFAWGVLGLAGGAGLRASAEASAPSKSGRQLEAILAATGLMILAGWMTIVYAGPLSQAQDDLAQAVQLARRNSSTLSLEPAYECLESARNAQPGDRSIYQAQLELLGVMMVRDAAPALAVNRPNILQPMQRKIEKLFQDAQRRGLLDAELRRTFAQIYALGHELVRDKAWQDRAGECWAQVAKLQPYSPQSRMQWADWLWAVGDRFSAVQEYRRALELNRGLYLDPLAQLPAKDVRRMEERSAGIPAAPASRPVLP